MLTALPADCDPLTEQNRLFWTALHNRFQQPIDKRSKFLFSQADWTFNFSIYAFRI